MNDRGVAFSLGSLDVYWYSLFIAAGVLIGFFVTVHLARRRGFSSEMPMDFLLFAIPLGIIGARLYYVAFNLSYFIQYPEEIFSLRMTGLAIYGAVLGGIVGGLIMSKWRKMSFWDITDAVVPALILAQAIGRWGNYVNQELYGAVLNSIPGGKIFPDFALFPPAVFVQGEWHTALFFYESVWNLLIFAILLWYWKKHSGVRGGATMLYFTLYPFGRMILEGMRLPEYILFLKNIAFSQVLSGVMFIVALGIFIYLQRKGGFSVKPVPDVYAIPGANIEEDAEDIENAEKEQTSDKDAEPEDKEDVKQEENSTDHHATEESKSAKQTENNGAEAEKEDHTDDE